MPFAWADGGIVADPHAPGNQQPTVLDAGNGVPLVNIQTPSAAGVSRNVYSRFDVDGQGAILNNARCNAQTQLAGWVQGNPNLAGGEARIILNEVNASDPSRLQGYVEVAGRRAQVVIANPAGISCDGCGFINANRATLTTGTPIMNGGRLEGYRVQRGTVSISGSGLDASDADYTDIIARAVAVQAGVWANDLRVTTGANQVDAANSTTTPISGDGASPAVAIDVAQLGGMYAGKITLKVTDAGAGVRNAGEIGAGSGGFVLTADGRVENSGKVSSDGSAELTTQGDLGNSGSLYAEGDVTLNSGGRIDNTNGLLTAAQGLNAQASSVGNDNGKIQAGEDLQITTPGTLDNANGLIAAGGALHIEDPDSTAKTLVVNSDGGTVSSGGFLNLDAAALNGAVSLQSGADLGLSLEGDYTHTGRIAADGNVTIALEGDLANQSSIQAGGGLALSAANVNNAAGAEISGQAVSLDVTNDLTNRGLIDGSETDVSSSTVHNTGSGRIYGDHVAVRADTLINDAEAGQAAVIAARSRMDIGVGSLENRDGALIFSNGDLALGGALDANGRATGSATTLLNTGATIESQGDMALSVLDLQNLNAGLTTEQYVDTTETKTLVQPHGSSQRFEASDCTGIGGGQDSNRCSGYPGTFEDYTLYRVTVTTTRTRVTASHPGEIRVGGDLQIVAHDALNQDSNVIVGGTAQVTGTSFNNVATQGQEVATTSGTAQYTHVEWCGSALSRHHCRKWDGATAYNPAPVTTLFSLPTVINEENSASSASGASVPASSASANPAGAAVSLPSSSLYHVQANNPNAPLIETDPQFADYGTWISSDYMLAQLATDPASVQQRLGDGFYEQQLLREQVAQLTGRRFLEGYADDEAQYQALMESGIAYAKAWDLVPGVALTSDQMAALTTDMVWLVEETVAMDDGSTRKVWAPKLYTRANRGDLGDNGALLSANRIDIDLSGEFVNRGTFAGQQSVTVEAGRLRNLGGNIRGDRIRLAAATDLEHRGGTIAAQHSLQLSAGNDLEIAPTTYQSEGASGDTPLRRKAPGGKALLTATSNVANIANGTTESAFSRQGIARQAVVSVARGDLSISAGRDVALNGATIDQSNDGEGHGSTRIEAGRDLTLGTVTVANQEHIVWDADNRLIQDSASEQGTRIDTQGDTVLSAGRDLTARAAEVDSGSRLRVSAANDLSIQAGQNTTDWEEARKESSSGFLSSTTTTTFDAENAATAQASNFGGNTVTLEAGHDVAISGSNVVSDAGTTVDAGYDVTVAAATDTLTETHFRAKRRSGLMSNGGLSITYGTQKQDSDNQATSTYAAASTLGSVGGNLDVNVGRTYTQRGSDLLTPNGDITVEAADVQIQEARETTDSTTRMHFEQSGISASITSPVIDTLQTADRMARAAKKTDNQRMKNLAAATAALSAYNNYQTAQANKAENKSGINLSISVGRSESDSTTRTQSDTARGSTLNAGGSIAITAAGQSTQGGEPHGGDILVQGSDVSAGGTLQLQAAGDIDLQSAENRTLQASDSEQSNASIGFSYGTGGLNYSLSASESQGEGNGTTLTHRNTHLTAGNTVILDSGNDTTLRGAVAEADRIIARIGGNLSIESQQDIERYHSDSDSKGFSLSVGTDLSNFGASVNASNTRIDSDYASVTEQSGLKAGDGGFQVDVTGHTELTGGVIAGSDVAVEQGNNRFQTASLGMSDIHNQAQFETDASGYSAGVGSQTGASGGLADGEDASAASVTSAGISGIAGNASVRSDDAETRIKHLFDPNDSDAIEALNDDLGAQVEITQAFSQEAPKAVGHFANEKIKAYERAKMTKEQAEAELAKGGLSESQRNQLQSLIDDATQTMAAEQNTYELWKEGGAYRVALHAAVGGLNGDLSGALGAGTTAAAAPMIEKMQASVQENLHSAGLSEAQAKIAGQVLAQSVATGIGHSTGGTHGALTGLAAEANNRQLHPSEVQKIKDLAEDYARQLNGGEEPTDQQIQGATVLLAQQALRRVDDKWNATFGGDDGWDSQADSFLLSHSDTQFRATAAERADVKIGMDLVFHADQSVIGSLDEFSQFDEPSTGDPYVVRDFYAEYVTPHVKQQNFGEGSDLLSGAYDATVVGFTDFSKWVGKSAAQIELGEKSKSEFVGEVSKGFVLGLGSTGESIDLARLYDIYGDNKAQTHEIGTLLPSVLVARDALDPKGGKLGSVEGRESSAPRGVDAGTTQGENIVPKGTPNEAFHYTDAKWKESINTNGLFKGSYATPDGTLSPMQATIDLALPPNRSLPNAKLRIDLDAMRRDGYTIPEPTRVSNVVKASDGRVYTRPGGGYEMKFDYKIPPQYISIVE